jgi:hypothetical protein
MALTISGAVLLAVTVTVLIRYGYLRFWPALAAALLGFLLASTGLAPGIHSGLNAVSAAVSHIHA